MEAGAGVAEGGGAAPGTLRPRFGWILYQIPFCLYPGIRDDMPRAKLALELALPGRFCHVLPHSAWGLRHK